MAQKRGHVCEGGVRFCGGGGGGPEGHWAGYRKSKIEIRNSSIENRNFRERRLGCGNRPWRGAFSQAGGVSRTGVRSQESGVRVSSRRWSLVTRHSSLS